MIPLPSRHLEALPASYAIARAVALRNRLLAEGRDVIDLSVGEPFLPPPPEANAALARAAEGANFNKYPPHRGTGALRSAFADFYRRRYGVQLDPETQVLPLLGSKEGLVNMTLALADESKPVYTNQVSYPVYRSAAHLAAAPIMDLGGSWETGYLPELPPADRCPGPGGIALVDCPGNPTGALIPPDAIERLLTGCRARQIAFCFDAAYVELRGAGDPVLPIPRFGDDGVVEFHSLSKSMSLAGWRVGFAVGSPAIVNALAKMKTFIDSGVPLPIQLAAVEALGACDAWIDQARTRYVEYQRQFRAALRGLPIELFPSEASMFCWARLPGVPGQLVAEACAEEAVVLIQGDSFGPAGADCFRMTANLADGPRLAELRARLVRVCERLAVVRRELG